MLNEEELTLPLAARRGVIAAALALVALLAVSHAHVDRMAYGDGLIYRYVAAHLTTPPSQIDPVVRSRGSSIRYGRIGFPALIWLASAGHNSVMPWTQAALIVLFAGITGAATAYLFPRAGPIGAIVGFMAPGFSLSVVGGYGEVMAAALVVWAVVLVTRARYWFAMALLAIAMLTRENAGAVLLGLLAWLLLRRKGKQAAILMTSLIPLLAWYGFVWARFGRIPLLDPYLHKTTDTIATPFVGIYHALIGGSSASVATASIHLALALIALLLWRRDVLAAVAAAAGLQVFSAGAFAWRFVGDAMRAFSFLELFLLLTVLRSRHRLGSAE